MKKTTTTLLALALALIFATAALAGNEYGWTISNSNSDPFSNTGAPTGGVATYYLWFQCSTVEGMAACEFAITSTGISHLATTAVNGYLNAGSTNQLLLAVGGCPPGPVIACNLLVLDAAGGEMCITDSQQNGLRVTVDCQAQPTAFPLNHIGFSSTGGRPSCDFTGFCPSIAIEDNSWGSIKGMYR